MPQLSPVTSSETTLAASPARGALESLFELPLLNRLPFRPAWVVATELLLLALLFMVLRFVIRRTVSRTSEVVASREEGLGNTSRASRVRTLASLTQSILTYALGFVVLVAALAALGVNILGLLGTAGVAGLAVGFGAQKLVKDVISGFFLLLEDQYAVGDYVSVNNITGVVEELGMRITRIRDDNGLLYILSNGDINMVCNQSRGPVGGSFEISVGAAADVAQAVETLNRALAETSATLGLENPATVAGVTATDAAKTTLRVQFQAAPPLRPADASLRLRESARAALIAAQLPLG